MAATTKFIDKSDFAPYRLVSQYIADAEIDPYILEVQETILKGFLNTDIYEDLQTAVENSTETAAQLALLEQITPFLVYISFQKFLAWANVKSTEMGFRVLTEKFSEPASPAQLETIRRDTDKTATYYERVLRNYLCANAEELGWKQCETTKESFASVFIPIKKPYIPRR